MTQLQYEQEEESNFLLQEVDRYKLTVFIDGKSAYNSGNDIEYLKSVYDNIIDENIENDKHIVLSIYDYNKEFNIHYYDSEHERC